MIISLFDFAGDKVHTISIPADVVVGIVWWQGRYFRLDNGRYIESNMVQV